MNQADANPIHLRVAGLEDAEGIARMHLESAIAAYRSIAGPQYGAGGLERRIEQWRRILSHDPTLDPPGAERVFVACEDDTIVGVCGAGASRDEDAGGAGEVHVIYVHPGRWRGGVGKQLLDAAIAYLVERGFSEATLWVLDQNQRARSFYEREGWQPDGASKPSFTNPPFSRTDVFQLRYRRRLS